MCLQARQQKQEMGIITAYKVFHKDGDELYSAFYPATFGTKTLEWEYPKGKWLNYKPLPNGESPSIGFYSFKYVESAFDIIENVLDWNLTCKYNCAVYEVKIHGSIHTGTLGYRAYNSFISQKIKVIRKVDKCYTPSGIKYVFGREL